MNENDNNVDEPEEEEEVARQRRSRNYLRFHRSELERVRRNDPSLDRFMFHDFDGITDAVYTDLHLLVGQALMGNVQLPEIVMSQVVFKTKESAQAVARGIIQSKLISISLTRVAVSEQVGDPACFWQTLCQGLKSMHTITKVHIHGIEQMEGIVALGNAFPRMHSLRELFLGFDQNTTLFLDESSVQVLARGIGQSKIESFYIHNQMQDTPGEKIQQLWHFLGQGLLSMQAIQELTLVDVSSIQAATVRDVLPLMHSLRRLVLADWAKTESDVQALASGIGKSKLQSLKIVRVFGREEPGRLWQILLQGIRTSKTMQELLFPSVPMEAVADLGDVLSSVPSLRKLVVTSMLHLTIATAQALAKGISQSKLEILEINHAFKGPPEESEHVRQIVYQGLQSVQTLKELRLKPVTPMGSLTVVLQSIQTLRLCNFQLDEYYGELLRGVLVRSTTLTTLELSGCNIRDSTGLVLLEQGLRANASVTSLVLKNCSSRGIGAEVFFAMGILDHVSITHLTMEGCYVYETGVTLLIENWPAHSPIQSLSLKENIIVWTTTRQILMRAVQDRRVLQRMDLSSNPMGYEGLKMLGEELVHQQHLTHVKLNKCITWRHYKDPDSDQAKEQELARCGAGQALLDCVVQNDHLHHLSLVDNGFLPDVEKEIGFYTSLNRIGRYLLSTHHGLPPTIWCHVFAKCQHPEPFGTSLIYYYLQQQPNLAQISQTC